MMLLAAGLTLLASAAASQDREEPASCVVCHGVEGRELAASVHARAGVGCTTCHGGVEGPLEKQAAHGDALKPLRERGTALEACGGCHADLERMRLFGLRTDQLALYRTSQHGQKLTADPEAAVATCVSCHGSHAVLRTSDPRSPAHPFNQVLTCGECHADAELMASYGLDPSVPSAYRGSVHGRALIDEGHISSPACTGCHGSHGATPPRVDEVGRVCGHCHSRVQEHFEESPHMAAAARGEITECISCHGDHGISEPSAQMLSSAPGGLCSLCHQGDPEVLATAEALHAGLAGLDEKIDGTALMLQRAAARGLFIDEESGYLGDARALRVRAGAVTHTLSPPALSDLLNRGQAMVQETQERLEIKARAFRDRKIFTAIFFAVAVVLALVLLTYRREIRGAWPASGRRAERGAD
ncbi:MAG TPA: hypothetical protein VMS76_10860 [Planctomycetota bacterium]|nr:hypothetical protein [Planctomycetota bacterium]